MALVQRSRKVFQITEIETESALPFLNKFLIERNKINDLGVFEKIELVRAFSTDVPDDADLDSFVEEFEKKWVTVAVQPLEKILISAFAENAKFKIQNKPLPKSYFVLRNSVLSFCETQ